jgi:hypothetical protein
LAYTFFVVEVLATSLPGKIPANEKQKSQKPAWALAFQSIAETGIFPSIAFPVFPAIPALSLVLIGPPFSTL